uniref:Protein kinase domain-containing protein n=1 Tax=Ananas comosus var. bracteatus TaxID=296719 RepID=A0A6V7PIB8_ANACO|nr:unnamed protein product [Ananas comosus var. bracteatus]
MEYILLFLLVSLIISSAEGTKSKFPMHHLFLTPRRLLLADIHIPPSSVGRFLAHPLWVGASVSFAVCFALGTVAFVLWRLSVSCCTNIKSAIRCPEEPRNNRATIFTPMLLDPENLSFIDHLWRSRNLPCPLEVIGRGGCGEVYKAVLVHRGRAVPLAIKKIVQPPADAAAQLCRDDSKMLDHRMRQIRSEIMTIGRIRHPNLLRLLAHVPQPGCHYLVYEFMQHGSLHDVMRRGTPPLDWPCRLKIALGVADGLEYLHTVHRPKVIHRDLKPGNILLDRDLNARIADFGLAKLVPGDAISGPMNSNNVAGTLGYIAPEYYQTLSYTVKSDVYSFGVILAVLVTGRFPSDEFFQHTDEMWVIGWVRAALQSEDPTAAIDRKLVGKGFEEQMLLVLKIACFCTYDDPNERPSSRDARHMLAQIKH